MHKEHLKILGQYHVADIRQKVFESTPGDIITWSDYAKYFIFEPVGQLQNELFDKICTLSMEGCCLDHFRKSVNVRNCYDNCGGYIHQFNDTVQEFHLHLYYSYLKNSATFTSHIYTLFARMFEKNK